MQLFVLACLLLSGVIAKEHDARETVIGTLNQEDFSSEALMAHNLYRRIHGVPAIRVNQKLNDLALKRATELAQDGKLNVKQIMFKGQNLGETVGTVGGFSSYNGISATQLWYSVVSKFDEEGESSNEGASFTQMVWKKTEQVGFGIAKSRDGKFYFVAEYFPSGNIRGQYEENVFQLTEETDAGKCVNQTVVDMWKKLLNKQQEKLTTIEQQQVDETTTTVVPRTKTPESMRRPKVEDEVDRTTTSTRRPVKSTTEEAPVATTSERSTTQRSTTATATTQETITKPNRVIEEADETVVEATTRRRATTTTQADIELERTTRRNKSTTPSSDNFITLDPSELPTTTEATTTERSTTERSTTERSTTERSTTERSTTRRTVETTEESTTRVPTTEMPSTRRTTTEEPLATTSARSTTVRSSTVARLEDDDIERSTRRMSSSSTRSTTTEEVVTVVAKPAKESKPIALDESPVEPTSVEDSRARPSKSKLLGQATQTERVKPKRAQEEQ